MAVVMNFPPLLFISFRTFYGFSYSQLGLFVLINYLTQLAIDLVFSFFSHKFNISKAVKMTPVLTFTGLIIYALSPFISGENTFLGLVIGTVIFSASGGFVEVLISPVIAAIPSGDPEREMSKLHSFYAWGVVGVVLISTAYILIFGAEKWQYLMLVFSALPMISAVLFFKSDIPEIQTSEKGSGVAALVIDKKFWLYVIAIFLGGAAECTMAQWASGYIEQGLGINKVWGDIFGVALFAMMLGLGRTLYAKKGKNIRLVLLLGALTSCLCYLLCSLTTNALVGLAACAATGICVSMLWPGTLTVAADKFPKGGVFIFAMMAAGGDFGASVGPQLVGVITDFALKNTQIITLANEMNLNPEQLGMKAGMFIGMIFPLVATVIYLYIYKQHKKA